MMGVWNDKMLTEWAESGGVYPFDSSCINPASIDLRWSGKYRKANYDGWCDVMTVNRLSIERGELFLLDTMEYIIMPENASGILALKSSMGRKGLEHLHAGFFDPGFSGTATLEIMCVAPWEISLEVGQRIVQLVLYDMARQPEVSYRIKGHYVDQREPQPPVA